MVLHHETAYMAFSFAAQENFQKDQASTQGGGGGEGVEVVICIFCNCIKIITLNWGWIVNRLDFHYFLISKLDYF